MQIKQENDRLEIVVLSFSICLQGEKAYRRATHPGGSPE